MKIGLLIIFMLGAMGYAHAQTDLTIQDAVQLGLEHNMAIKVSRKTAEISQNNYDLSYGALLPTFGVTASKSFSEQNVTQQLARSNEVNEIKNASTNNFNVSPQLNWTIFDGLGMFVTRERLKNQALLGEDDLRVQIENNIALISNAFYRVVLENERLRVFQDALDLSRQRLDLAQTRYEVGKASKLVFLQAQVDYNADSSNLLSQQELIYNVSVELNRLLGQDLETVYDIESSFEADEELSIDNLLASAQLSPAIIRAQRNRDVSYLQIKEVNAQKFPTIGVNFGYSYNNRNSDAGAVLSNISSGTSYGISASWTIFNGFDLKRRQQNAKIQIELNDLQMEDLRLSLESDLRKNYINYENSIRLKMLEEQNLEVARENYDIALERFKVGNSNAVELREAQVNLVQAEIRKITAQYNVKLAEIELKRLAGNNVNQ